MKKSSKAERREYPRIRHSLALKIATGGYDFSTTSQDVSAVGTYCTVEKYIPPFTKLAVRLTLPIDEKGKKCLDIECKGVVVRTEDAETGGFNLAIFFNEITEPARKKIAHYINQFLPRETTPSLN